MVNTYRGSAPSYASTKRWVSEFKRGRESLKDSDRCGRPAIVNSPETISKVLEMVMLDRIFTTRPIAETLHVSHATVLQILIKDLQMRKISAWWVSRL